jgi:DNA replication and repair protein RecF
VIALKLAQYRYLQELNEFSPILLLDDIFDKLDDSRVGRLMELVTGDAFGQIFITDTHPERVPSIFSGISIPLRVFHVENGTAKEPAIKMNR